MTSYQINLLARSLRSISVAAKADPSLLPSVRDGFVLLRSACRDYLELPAALVQVTRVGGREFPINPSGCKALLLEIVRRASYDWVLYRTSAVLPKRRLADDAFTWLFKEQPGHPAWSERKVTKKEITSFLSICELLELDPDFVRMHIRRLTVQSVLSIGRPAEYRRHEWADDAGQYKVGAEGGKALAAMSDRIDELDLFQE